MKFLKPACWLLTVASLYGEPAISTAALNGLAWRSIGPAVMGGRISDIEGVPGNMSTVFAAAGSGGLFRTLDGGMTWDSLFDRQSTISIGAIAVQPGNPRVIWVGTGESNVRNSVSFGDGVYKSEDGGLTWKNVGLANTETISRIVIDPKNPLNVFVAAVGHPFGPNSERGVFVTHDGGQSWRKTLYLDDVHGASDLDIDPADPNIIFACLWRFDRKPWTYSSGDTKGGVYKSEDGGNTWNKLTVGLPKLVGRLGVKVAPSASHTVYVIAESREGTLFRSDDSGASFRKISAERELIGRGYYFTDLRVSPESENHLFVLADALLESIDAGAHFRRASPSVHGDLHALWIDPRDPRRIWQGNDGGLAVSYDAAGHWAQINNIPLGQFYRVSADDRKPFYKLTAGMQDNGTWTGPSRTREPAGIFNSDWTMLNAFVGFHSISNPDDPDLILTEQPGGTLLMNNLKTGEQQAVSPQSQSFSGAPARDMRYRFNWDAPLVRSPFGNSTIYLAGNVVFQSSDYGRSWENISHDLTRNDPSRLGNIGGPIWTDNSAAEVYSTITTLAESPAKRGVLWAGTDDGNLQLTINGGGVWTNLAKNVPGMSKDSPVSHVEPSHTNARVAYLSLDRHMFDDFQPYLFRTADSGQSWESIAFDLPRKAFIWTVREDPRSPGLLYAGTELGIYALWPGSKQWLPLHLRNMPWSIAVRDIIFQPATGDMIVATHGRSLWLLDDASLLAQLPGAIAKPAALFPIRPALRYPQRAAHYGFGDQTFTAPNPAYGALISYYLGSTATQPELKILDGAGNMVATLLAPGETGIHRVSWDLRYPSAGQGPRARKGRQALPGRYTARLTANGVSNEQTFTLEINPALQVSREALNAQFEMSAAIERMQSGVSSLLLKVNGAKAPQAAAVEELSNLLTRPAGLGRSEAAPRLRENLDALFNLIDSADAAPTAAQTRYFHQLQDQYGEISARVAALTASAGR